MASKHHLALDIPHVSCETIIRINDASVYSSLLDYDCPRLDVTLPGFNQPFYVTESLQKYFSLNVSGKTLQLQAENDDKLISLPDGLYTIRYSVSPNDDVYVEYYHLRTTKITNLYLKELCKLRLQECEPTAEMLVKLQDLRFIKSLIDAAKAKAEVCHSPKQSTEMLFYAEKLLKKFMSGCCITCK